VELARRSGHAYSLVLALCYAAAFHVMAEDRESAREAAEEAARRARSERLPSHRAFAELMRAAALPAPLERLTGMLAALPGLVGESAQPQAVGASGVRALFTQTLAELGQREPAAAQLAEAFADAERSGEREPIPGLHLLRASLAVGEDEVERELAAARAAADALGHRMAGLQVATERARREARRGPPGEAAAELARRLGDLAGEPDVPVLARARAVLAAPGTA
jgi:hypothetical protein